MGGFVLATIFFESVECVFFLLLCPGECFLLLLGFLVCLLACCLCCFKLGPFSFFNADRVLQLLAQTGGLVFGPAFVLLVLAQAILLLSQFTQAVCII